MNELENEVLKANPNKLVDVGNFRMDADGNTIRKKVRRWKKISRKDRSLVLNLLKIFLLLLYICKSIP